MLVFLNTSIIRELDYIYLINSFGTVLLFQRATPSVLSPLQHLTTEFEMDRCGSTVLLAPKHKPERLFYKHNKY